MKFFDVRSSVEIPDLPAESFERKLMGAFQHYNIKADKPIPVGKILFCTSFFQFGSFIYKYRYRRPIFQGVSFGEIEYFNQGENLIVRFKLSLRRIRVLILALVLLMITISVFQDHYAPLIMAGWMVILYLVVIVDARYKFKRWFSRFTK
jgi:hypothetical protein